MAFVTCVGCNRNCDIPTSDDEVFMDDIDTYSASCWCPSGQCWVEFDSDDLKRAYEEDNGTDDVDDSLLADWIKSGGEHL